MNIDWSLGVGVFGIFVSIAVGLGTFWAADRRTQRNRLLTARGLIVQVLSRSLADGSIPKRPVIEAVVRSVLREQGTVYDEQTTVAEVIDDMLRQVASAPFLEADRRSSLQSQLLALSSDSKPSVLKEPGVVISSEGSIQVGEIIHHNTYSYPSWRLAGNLLLGVASSIVAAVALLLLVQNQIPKNFGTWLSENSAWMVSGVGVAVLSVVLKVYSNILASWQAKRRAAEHSARADG